MTNVLVDVKDVATERSYEFFNAPNGEVIVSDEMFGTNFVNHDFEDYRRDFEYFDSTLIRWPGGTLSEEGGVDPSTGVIHTHAREGDEVAYSLDHQELMHPAALANGKAASLTELFAYAVEQDVGVSITIPTSRHLGNPGEAYDKVYDLLEQIFTEGSYGEIPPVVSFDIGNERYDNPVGYGEVSLEILKAVGDFRSAYPAEDFGVALQTMQSRAETQALVETMTGGHLSADYQGLLSEVDIIRHHALQLNLDAGKDHGAWNLEDLRYYWIDPLMDAVTDASGGEQPELYFSEWSANSDDVIDTNTGLPAASSMLTTFTAMLELGGDAAGAWGVDTSADNGVALSMNGDGGTRFYTPAGEMLRMMAETLPGMTLLDTESLDYNRDDPYQMAAFTDDSKAVIFLSPNEFEGDTYSVTIDLTGFGDIGHVWSESLETVDGSIDGTLVAPEDTRETVQGNPEGTITITFDDPYEMTRIIISKEDPGSDSLILWSDDAADELHGGAGDDVLRGGGGDDILRGGAGADHLDGGAGIDTLDYGTDTAGIMVRLYNGTAMGGDAEGDTFTSSFENLTGGAGDDTLGGNVRDNVLRGNDGADTLWGGHGDDTLIGGAGDDVLRGGGGDDILRGGAGADHLDGGAGIDTLDYSTDTAGISVELHGRTAMGGDAEGDTFTSSFENLTGGAGDDRLSGDDGDNVLRGNNGTDILWGGHGDDTLIGGAGDDVLRGRSGDDVLRGGAGADHLDGGDGIDTLDYSTDTVGIIADLNSAMAMGGDAEGDTFTPSFENLTGGAGDDRLGGDDGDNVLRGNNGTDILWGGHGDDTLIGGVGDDVLLGGAGDDILRGGAGADYLDGGEGIDTLDYSGDTTGVRIDIWKNTATGGEAAGDTLTDSFENIIGGSGNDLLAGNRFDNVLTGGRGADILVGDAGNDILRGMDGADDFVFDDGLDHILDFEDDIDRLVLDEALWGGGKTAADVLNDHATLGGGGVELSFGGGADVLTLDGFTDIAALENDIAFV